MPACSHKRCTDQRMPGSEYCQPHRKEALQRIKPSHLSAKQLIVRELRWRSGTGSGVVV